MSEYMNPVNKSVLPEESGLRLDRFLRRYYPAINQAFLEKALRKGLIRLEGKKTASNERLVDGQVVTIFAAVIAQLDELQPAAPSDRPVPKKQIDLLLNSIQYRDDYIIVLNKPAGLAVQGGSKITVSVDSMLDSLRFDKEERPKLVHRLDKDTSGLLIIARSAHAATLLTEAFRDKTMKKTYWAIVAGTPQPAKGEINLPVGKTKNADGHEQVTHSHEHSLPAVTHYKTLHTIKGTVSWLEMMPITGRTHQLRVHAASLDTPILSDGKYGGKRAFIPGISKQLHLHARHIKLPPLWGKVLEFTAPLPDHMQKTIDFFGF